MVDRNLKTGRFIPGNKAAYKGYRKCANYPFCQERINSDKYPNKLYHHPTCKRYAKLYRKSNNLIKKGI